MRMSCNGCRILRKGCSETCTLRPCLQWIESSEAQSNATVFLAKFYGRAGLLNLINAGPDDSRPAIFRTLLYEACGRIINPIYGSVGLMWDGNWKRCEEAVAAVLNGSEVVRVPTEEDGGAESLPIMPFKGCDIRHISKDSALAGMHRVRTKNRFKRSGSSQDRAAGNVELMEEPAKFSITGWGIEKAEGFRLESNPSHGSSSLETVEPGLMNRVEPGCGSGGDLNLELTLGFSPVGHPHLSTVDERTAGDV